MKKNNFKFLRFLFFLLLFNILFSVIFTKSSKFLKINNSNFLLYNRNLTCNLNKKIILDCYKNQIFLSFNSKFRVHKQAIFEKDDSSKNKFLIQLFHEKYILKNCNLNYFSINKEKLNLNLKSVLKVNNIVKNDNYYECVKKFKKNIKIFSKNCVDEIEQDLFLKYFKKNYLQSNQNFFFNIYKNIYNKKFFSKNNKYYANCSILVIDFSRKNDFFTFKKDDIFNKYKINFQFDLFKKIKFFKSENISVLFLIKYLKENINIHTKNLFLRPFQFKDKIFFIKINYIFKKNKHLLIKNTIYFNLFFNKNDYYNYVDNSVIRIFKVLNIIKINRISFKKAIQIYFKNLKNKNDIHSNKINIKLLKINFFKYFYDSQRFL